MIGGPLTLWPIIVGLVELVGALRPPAGLLVWGGVLLALLGVARAITWSRWPTRSC